MSFSEKYQAILDKINNRLPIKAITNPIDKIHPLTSFFVFLFIIVIVLYFVFFSGASTSASYKEVTIKLADNNSQILKNFSFTIKDVADGTENEYKTDNTGQAKLSLDSLGEYEFVVQKSGYKLKTLTISPAEQTEYRITLEIFALPDHSAKTLSFVDKDTGQAITESMNVRIRCQNGVEITPTEAQIAGTMDINLPNDCGQMVATANSTSYFGEGIIISAGQSVVNVSKKELVSEKGDAKIVIRSGNDYPDGITVRIFLIDDLINPVSTKEIAFGSVRFAGLAVGSYKAVASDSQNRFLSGDVQFDIVKDGLTTKTIEILSIAGQDSNIATRTITATLKDSSTGLEITSTLANASVTLLKDGNQTIDVKQYVTGGVSFVIPEDGSYSMTGKADGYISLVKVITPNVNSYTITLDKITEDNASDINTYVYDEDNLPVSSATVYIYDSASGYIDSRFSPELTDSNGKTRFENIPDGNYYLEVKKVFISGNSQSFHHAPPVDSNIAVPVVIGEGKIELAIKNSFGDAVPDCLVSIYNSDGALLGSDYSNAVGVFTKSIKADKIVYLVISKDGYINYNTELIIIYKNQTITKDIAMSREYVSNTPNIDLLGIYNTQGTAVNYLSQNKVYYFKFRLTNPTSSTNMGFVFRIGSELSAEDDVVYIKPLTTLNDGIAVYYSSSPFMQTVAEGTEAKLVDVYLQDIETGVYELTVPVQVVNALQGTAIPVKYKAYITSSGNYETNPESILEINNKTELFNSLPYIQQTYYIDVDSMCNDKFCISGQYVDIDDNISYDIDESPIAMLVNGSYLLNYSITNAENDEYSNARLYVKNIDSTSTAENDESLDISSYDVSGAFSGEDETTGDHHFKIPFIEDYFSSDKIDGFAETKLELATKALYAGSTRLNNKIVAEQTEIYNHSLDFAISNQYSMSVTYTPENIVPGTSFDLQVSAKNSSGMPIENAIVNVYHRINGYQYTVYTGRYTNSDGIATMNMPALNIGETIIIEVQKASYYAEPIEITITQDLLDTFYNGQLVTPQNPLEINIHKDDVDGLVKSITLKNKTDYALTLQAFNDSDISFIMSSLLDLAQTKNFLNSQASSGTGFVIPAHSEKTLDIKLVPSIDARELVDTVDLTGVITGHVTQGSAIYPFDISLKSKISVGNGVETDDCLVVEGYPNPWTAVVNGGRQQSINFIIRNNCIVKDSQDQPATLKNIRVKVVQNGDRYGYYDLTINNSTERLAEGVYKTIIEDIAPQPSYYSATLKYSAGATTAGEIKTDIYINGQIETDDGLSYVNSVGSPTLSTDLSILNVSDCIDFYDNGAKINDMFVIESGVVKNVGYKELTVRNNCSDAGSFKVTFCPGKLYSGCQPLDYGNMTGTYDNEIEFSAGQTEQKVKLYKPEVPGAYTILAKVDALNDYGAVVATAENKLKINVQDLLFMDDPFIEVSQENEEYQSMPVKLMNKDINKTPWNYAIQRVAEDNGFSKFMPAGFNVNNTGYQNMLFNEMDNLQNVDTGRSVSELGTVGVGVGVAYVSSIVTGVAYGAAWSFVPELAFIGPVGWVAIGVLTVTAIISSISDNDYVWRSKYLVADVDPTYTTPGLEASKMINVSDNSDATALISVFDITGARYMTYLQGIGSGHGKLSSDKTLKMTVPKCNGQQHRNVFDEFHTITKSDSHCDDSFKELSSDSDNYYYGVKCNGSWPRKHFELGYSAYTSCAYDQTIWPEQAGIKPLIFSISGNSATAVSEGDNIYKTIVFYPTLNDGILSVDPAFAGAPAIGKFRFELHSSTQESSQDVDLNVYACSTDSDKTGVTGPGAVPEINLDWSWNIEDIGKCTNNYCDATQLTQEILDRINSAKQLLDSQIISCPKSQLQLAEEAQAGIYHYTASEDGVANDVPAGKVGISTVDLAVDGNLFKVVVTLENRLPGTTGSINKTVNVSLNDEQVTSITYYDHSSQNYITEDLFLALLTGIYSKTISVPYGEDNTTEVIFTFGSLSVPVIGEDLELEVTADVDSGYNSFDTNVDLNTYPQAQQTSDCEVPATTAQLNGVDYLDMWFDVNQYSSNVVSPWSQEDLNDLKTTLSFNAYLISDNYNSNFINDFDKAYGGGASQDAGAGVYSFLVAPSEFTKTKIQNGYLSQLFKDNFAYTLKYSSQQANSVSISTPGLYNVRIDLVFNNSNWKFTADSQNIDANAVVTFTYLNGPESDSIFYRLPFDGFVGYNNSSYNRQNYGLAYLGDEIVINNTSTGLPVKTAIDNGSNPFKYLNVAEENDVFKLNSDIESRGNILSISENEDNYLMVFSPAIATPVMLKVTRSAQQPFNVIYQLLDESGTPMFGGTSLTRWNGVGDYYDFSGDYVYSAFNNYFDTATQPEDNKPNAYKIEWSNVSRKGSVYLRSIFYTPIQSRYTLVSKTTGSDPKLEFALTDGVFSTSKDIQEMPSSQDVDKIQNVIDLIEDGYVCVTNSSDGKSAEFWWNPAKVYGENTIFTGNGISGISN